MKNPLEMLKEIKSVLGIELSETPTEETKLAQMTLENGTIIEAEDFTPEAEVFIVTEEDKIALPVGEYALEDGMILVVEAEGIIKEIKEATSEEEVVEEEVEAAEEEMSYATKEELAEVKSMIEEIKAMIKDKEDMAAVEAQVKEELSSTPAAAPLKHNPEGNVQTKKVTFGHNRPQSIQDRVFARIANIQK
tara:strand:+ start:202 stop:777 length:576 start_codon:yes stop_codon:yes gene_type:complete